MLVAVSFGGTLMVWKLLHSRAGNFGIMGALCMMPLLLAGAAAVDFSNLVRTRSQLQNANDAAAFMFVRQFDRTNVLPDDEEAKRTVSTNFGRTVGSSAVALGTNELAVVSDVGVDLFFGSILPASYATVSVESAVSLPDNRVIQVAMALDSTNSMKADNKLASMKAAAKNFVKTLTALQNDRTEVSIGLVPFAQYVNVGVHRRNEKWLDVPPDMTVPVDEDGCTMHQDYEKSNCRSVTRYEDGVPYQAEQCDWTAVGEKYEVCNQTHTYKWNGCVGSRLAPLTLSDSRPDVPFPGLQNVWCANELVPLTSDAALLTKSLQAIKANGETYIVEGIMWGLRLLSEQVPFTEAATDADPEDVEKFLVVMTDGDNSRSAQLPGSRKHQGEKVAEANAWSVEACNTARNAGIRVFTITYGKDVTAEGKALMEGCASDDNFYMAAEAGEIDGVFQQIASEIASVRLIR